MRKSKRRRRGKQSVHHQQAEESLKTTGPAALIREALRQEMHTAMLGMVSELFRQEVEELCGQRYERHAESRPERAGSEKGSIYWAGQRRAVRRPRVRDKDREVQLQSYAGLRDYDLFSREVQRLLLRGISTRDYSAVTEKLDQDLGLSRSSASRAFIQASQKDLDELNGRDLAGEQYCCIMIDGLGQGDVHLVTALGFTIQGDKRILGIREGATENAEVVKDLLASIIERQLSTTEQVLFVLDGGKALHKAVRAQWGDRAVIQRCQEHKIRNVLSYLPNHLHSEARRRQQAAYNMSTYRQAQEAMKKLMTWLKTCNEAAARSLAEGLEETLTVHRLGLPELLRRTFRTTNPIESMFGKVRSRSTRVKRWRAANQFARWTASALLLHEKTFRRAKGYRQMHVLVTALANYRVDAESEVA